jgi:hypothetical protein
MKKLITTIARLQEPAVIREIVCWIIAIGFYFLIFKIIF